MPQWNFDLACHVGIMHTTLVGQLVGHTPTTPSHEFSNLLAELSSPLVSRDVTAVPLAWYMGRLP